MGSDSANLLMNVLREASGEDPLPTKGSPASAGAVCLAACVCACVRERHLCCVSAFLECFTRVPIALFAEEGDTATDGLGQVTELVSRRTSALLTAASGDLPEVTPGRGGSFKYGTKRPEAGALSLPPSLSRSLSLSPLLFFRLWGAVDEEGLGPLMPAHAYFRSSL